MRYGEKEFSVGTEGSNTVFDDGYEKTFVQCHNDDHRPEEDSLPCCHPCLKCQARIKVGMEKWHNCPKD